MSSLQNSYRNIANSNNFHIPPIGEALEAIGSVDVKVPSSITSWTVGVTGPDSDYTIYVKAVGMSEFRPVSQGVIDGTSAGNVSFFKGNVSEIRIEQVSASGNSFKYSLIGNAGI